MLSRILDQEEAIRHVFSMDRKTTHLLLDIAVIKAIDEALAPHTPVTRYCCY